MKTFADLVFTDMQPPTWRVRKAVYMFDNGYGISVLCGAGVSDYTDDLHPYTAALLDSKGVYVRNTDRYKMTENDVSNFMKEIQELKEI